MKILIRPRGRARWIRKQQFSSVCVFWGGGEAVETGEFASSWSSLRTKCKGFIFSARLLSREIYGKCV